MAGRDDWSDGGGPLSQRQGRKLAESTTAAPDVDTLRMRRTWVIKSGQAKRGNTLFNVGEGNMPVAFGREYVATY
jgi:hypothetical protein